MPVDVLGCTYPTSAELMALEPLISARGMRDRLAFDLFPFANTEFPEITLYRPDIFRGLQQHRGLNKPSPAVKDRLQPGTYCNIQPGYWGEHDSVDEKFLVMAADPRSQCHNPIDLTEHISRLQDRLVERRLNLMEFNIWQALTTGHYEALDVEGRIIFEQTFNIRFVASGIPWSNLEDSTPMGDFRCIKLLQRGTDARFDTCARAYMNQVTANCLFKNRNRDDVGRHGLSACCDFMGLDVINQQLAAQQLPQITIYEEGYYDEARNFNMYIPDGKVVFIGCLKHGSPVGNYWYTRNAVGCPITSGVWQKIVDSCEREVPRTIELHDLHNGAPVLSYPEAVSVLETGCDFEDGC